MGWIRQHVAKFALLLGALVIAVFIVDRAFYLYLGKPRFLKDTDRSLLLREIKPGLITKVTPTKSFMVTADSLQQKAYKVAVDDNGFITTSALHDKDRGNVDIVFLGGSTTEALYVEEEARFAHLVSTQLENRSGAPLNTRNAAKSGNHTLHSLLILLGKVIDKQPSVVVLMHNANDLGLLSRTGSYWSVPDLPGKQSLSIVQDSRSGSHQSFKQSTTNFFRRIKDIIAPNIWQATITYLGNPLRIGYGQEWNRYTPEIVLTDREMLDEFERALRAYIEIARAWDINPVLMTQMNRINLTDELVKNSYSAHLATRLSYTEFVALHESFNALIRNIGKVENVLVIDLDKHLSDQKLYMYDSMHLNTHGSEKAAEIISQSLASSFPNLFQMRVAP